MTVERMIDEVIRREGGYVNHPDDRGGPTNFGITRATLSRWLKRQASVLEVSHLDIETAREIYLDDYYIRPGIDRLPEPWQPLVFDWGVNSGPSTAIRELQKLCNLHGCHVGRMDGVIGPKTIAGAQKFLREPLHWYLNSRRDFYHRLVANDPSQQVFLKGWLARVDRLEEELVG